MRNILFVSRRFPPIQSPTSIGSLRFVKYLTRMGCNLTVLTAKRNLLIERCDPSLLSELPKGISIYRTRSSTFLNLLPWWALSKVSLWTYSMHYEFGWLPFAISKGKKILKKQNIDVIISRSTPIASHLVAFRLKLFSGLPWIADFSDPWVQGNPFLKYKCKFFRKIDESLERQVTFAADSIIFTSEGTKAQFLNKHRNTRENKVRVIPNSYDSEDFIKPKQVTKSDNFVIVHTGSFYYDRSPEPFFRALKLLKKDRDIRNIKVKLIGNMGGFSNLVTKYGLGDIVEVISPVPHKEALSYLYSADILLLVDAPFFHGASVFLPLKLVEYIRVGKPILAITPKEGTSADVVRSTKTGVVVSPNDITSIKNHIKTFYYRYENSNLQIKPDWDEINKYSAESCTRILVKIIDELIQ